MTTKKTNTEETEKTEQLTTNPEAANPGTATDTNQEKQIKMTKSQEVILDKLSGIAALANDENMFLSIVYAFEDEEKKGVVTNNLCKSFDNQDKDAMFAKESMAITHQIVTNAWLFQPLINAIFSTIDKLEPEAKLKTVEELKRVIAFKYDNAEEKSVLDPDAKQPENKE